MTFSYGFAEAFAIHRRRAAGRAGRSAIAIMGMMAAMAAAGCRTSKPALTPLEAQGKQVFAVGCAHCHVYNNWRITPAPPDLHGLFTRKTLPDGEPATDAEVERVLMTGKGKMPSFAYQMTSQQMTALIAYLHVYKAGPHK
jgi:mono/diheme cytochrome c family protein